MKKIFFLLITTQIFVSCEDHKTISKQTSKNEVGKTVIDTVELLEKSLEIENKPKTEQLLILFSQRKREISDTLKTISKTEANKLYETYLKDNQLILSKLIEAETNTLDKFYSENSETKNLIKKKEKELLTHGLEFDEIGEGMVEIGTKNDYYYNIFKNYVTDDYKDYLEIKKDEDKSLYSADAGLAISFKELGDRIAVWENYMAKYPNSNLTTSVKVEYKYYQKDYIFGLDNTPTFERANPEKKFIYPENIEEFNRFKSIYSTSPTNKLIEIFLEHFHDENVHKLIEIEQSKV